MAFGPLPSINGQQQQMQQEDEQKKQQQQRLLELDLDALERGWRVRKSPSPAALPSPSPDSMELVKLVLLGAPGVGKTSIVQQFVWNDFSEEYVPTTRKHTYYPSVIINERLYELKISDIPVIPYFPVNSFYEWTDYRFYGLRSASAYVLVFDLAQAEQSFQYIRALHEQMLESRDMRTVPLLVVGNKQDLILPSDAAGSGGGAAGAAGPSNALCHVGGVGGGAELREKRRRDIANTVKRQWKCAYVECSAKYNWHVVAVFKEVMRAVHALEAAPPGKDAWSPMADNLHGALDSNRCVVL